MESDLLVNAFLELFDSLSDEQKRAIHEGLQTGAALIQRIIEAERARQPARLPAQPPAQPADIPDMRGRWP